jgi:glycosyltransferase involved in cell wall biosynthesis
LEKLTQGAFLGYNVLENDGKSYYYSLANKTFDYMQSGVPVLCSAFPEYKALSGEYPFILFAEAESTSIASTIRLLLESPEMYNELRAAALLASKTLNWEAEQVKLLDIYDGLSNAYKKEVDR